MLRSREESVLGIPILPSDDRASTVVTEDELVMLYELGNLARQRGQRLKAEAVFRSLISIRGHVAGGYVGLSTVYLDQGRVDEAIELLEATSKLEGKHFDVAQAFLGYSLFSAGRWRDGARVLQAVVDGGRTNNGVDMARDLLENNPQDQHDSGAALRLHGRISR